MPRETGASHNQVALLATGDEITNGDILNSNAQVIAQTLFQQGIHVGMHMAVADNIADIEDAIHYLLKNHRALIITGGLGPTSDDLTRYALSRVVQRPLIFNETVWQTICERFKTLGYVGAPPEGNRQQALFPEGAAILSNARGTAAGCSLLHQDKFIFMLPGPPVECLPMVEQFVVPALLKYHFQEIMFYNHWLLFGVSESVIAEELDRLTQPFKCVTGYRLAYPYIEFKVYSSHESDFKHVIPLIEQAVAPYLISDGKQTASAMLIKQLENSELILGIRDRATGGLLENLLTTPRSCHHLNFHPDQPHIEITGLTDYWQNNDVSQTDLEILFLDSNKLITKTIPLRGRRERARMYAVEFICSSIFEEHARSQRS